MNLEKNQKLIRAFFALEINDDLRAKSHKIIQYLKQQPHGDKVKWVASENLHITVRFLGNIDTQTIAQLIKQVDAAVVGMPSISIPILGVEPFPATHAHVIAFTFSLTQEHAQLVKLIEDTTVACKLAPEMRPYSPHLTLARLRGAHYPDLQHIPIEVQATFMATKLVLMQSDLTDSGSIYTPLAQWELIN